MNTEIIIDRRSIQGSYNEALLGLAEVLGSKEDALNLIGDDRELKNDALDRVITLLKQKDNQLVQKQITDGEKSKILEAIWKYKILCNKNEAEKRVANTLNSFIKEIYKDSFHFFLELIQNADDASKGGDKHHLKITLDKDYNIIFEYDERGFNFSDIFSITSLGNSTKKAQLDDQAEIGEKGIGFKSIFSIAKEIDIKSKYFSFNIQASEDKLSSILEPAKITVDTSSNTVLTLKLKDEAKTEKNLTDINKWMEEQLECKAFANPFLFLKNIRSVSYLNENSDEGEKTIVINKDLINDVFTHVTIEDKEYIVYTEYMKFDKAAIISRWNHLIDEVADKNEDFAIDRPVQIAYPLIPDNLSKDSIPMGKIYSYLPTTIEVNIPVFINLDVHLTASRGNITKDDFAKDSTWNDQVEQKLPQFLLNAYLKIVATHTSELQDNEHLKKLRESLYYYIPTEVESGSYGIKLTEFKDKIKEEAIILTNEGVFNKLSDVFYVSSSRVCKEYDESQLQTLYQFINSEPVNLVFPKTVAWDKLVYKIGNCKGVYDVYHFVEAQNGIKNYWDKKDANKELLEKIIKMLATSIADQNSCKDIDIIPVECKDNKNGFELLSYNNIEEGFALFLHSSDKSIEDFSNSRYIYEADNEIKGLKELVSKTYDIQKYELNDYFKKEANKIKENVTEESVNRFITRTFRFYQNNSSCFDIDRLLPKVVKEFLSQYTLSEENWDKCKSEKVCYNYVKALSKLTSLELWQIPQDVDVVDKYIDYLMCLGIKHKIDFINNDLDEKSYEILDKANENEFKIYINETDRYIEIKSPLLNYFLVELNNNAESISKNNLNLLCEKFGLYSMDNTKYMYGDKEIIILNEDTIESINKRVNELKSNNRDIYSLKDSRFCIISKKVIPQIWNKLAKTLDSEGILTSTNWDKIIYGSNSEEKEKGASVENKFINSFNRYDQYFLKDLRMISILNRVFNTQYAWGYDDTPTNLSINSFLSCYKELSDNENIANLFRAGYTVDLDDTKSIDDYFEEFEDLNEFLNTIRISEEKGLMDLIDLSLFAIIDNQFMKENYITFDEKNNKTDKIKYLIKKEDKHSNVINYIAQVIGIKLYPYQKKEIEDYFGEIKNNAIVPKESEYIGNTQYCPAVFFDFHVKNIEKAKINLKSIWDKDILKDLCLPLTLTDNTQMEGYGYTCPICGEKSCAALSGMIFGRFKHAHSAVHPYLYIVSCLNCNSMLKYAKSIVIKDFDQIMENFENCYCMDNNHVRNHASMMTVTLEVKTWDNKTNFLPMKISYLNMVLYAKFAK